MSKSSMVSTSKKRNSRFFPFVLSSFILSFMMTGIVYCDIPDKSVLAEKQIKYTSSGESIDPSSKNKQQQSSTLNEWVAGTDREGTDLTNDLTFRTKNIFTRFRWSHMAGEFSMISEGIRSMFSIKFWSDEITSTWESGGYLIISFAVLFVFTQMMLVRFRKYLLILTQREAVIQWSALKITLKMLERSLMLLSAMLFLFIYTLTGPYPKSIWTISALVQIWLYTRWGLDFIKFWEEETDNRIFRNLKFLLHFFLQGIRYGVGVYIIIAGFLEDGNGVLIFTRLLFEIVLIIGVLNLARILRQTFMEKEPSKKEQIYGTLAIGSCYVIAFGGFAIELVGYSSLAVFWFLSWGRTAIVALWGGLIYTVLRGWATYYQTKSMDETDESLNIKTTFSWFFIKVAQLFWLAGIIVSLVLAWGGRKAMLYNIFIILKYPLPVGNMRFSLMGFIYFILVLLATHTAAKVWRYFFEVKFLKKSGMEIGLQDSITTISVYIIWVIGILISLHMMGFNTTSLAVAFGALGIGLGFGLQTIFNNFISGIILLFERPIQIGDDIEINGTWATVKKINVRSTVVQTYDNASLIVPNSDLIVNQVTNWSFKDKRIRRNISVGVAYGSDVELVRETLLEVAEKTSRVLKYPKPDVVFVDFGDNALVFRLRLWTNVAYFYAVETDVRFEIDRLFRERKITIAFPQRDIRIIPQGKKEVIDEGKN